MDYSDPIDSYTGTIGTLSFGHKKQITIGGEDCLSFYTFEGKMPHKPLVALEVWDMAPDNWPKILNDIYGDVYEDPVKWARKCVEEFKARAISIKLASTDPNGLGRSPEEAAQVVKKMVEAVDVNIFTDPQKPMQVEEKIYDIGDPDENSPVLVSTNFSLTYFIVSGEIEASKAPTWLMLMDSEGQSVLTAWAAGKFIPEKIALFVKKSGIAERVSQR